MAFGKTLIGASVESGPEDGKYQIYSGVSQTAKLSSNYGSSFSSLGTISGTNGVAISGNGQYILVGGIGSSGTTYLSSDYGASFSPTSLQLANTYSYDISESGQYMVAGISGYGEYSDDYGQTWNNFLAGSGDAFTSMSRSGQYIYLATRDNWIYYTTDFWYQGWNVISGFGVRSWNSVAISETFGTLIAGDNYWLWKTTDNGATNTKLLANMGGDIKCAISGDGQYILAGANNFNSSTGYYLYYSSNGGTSFGSHRVFGYAVVSVAMSLTGQYQLSVWDEQNGGNNRIYFSSDYGVTITHINTGIEYLKAYVSRSTL